MPLSNFVVTLSDQSRHLMAKIKPTALGDLRANAESMQRADLLRLLKSLDTQHSSDRFLLESLRASLLKDLRLLFTPEKEESKHQKEKAGLFSKLMFWLLTIGGTVLAVCEGYDGMMSLLPLVSTPVWIGQMSVAIFVVLSVAAFYAFDLNQISENLGVKLPETRKLLDVSVDQAQEIRLMRKLIENINTSDLTELNFLSDVVAVLKKRQTELNGLQAIYLKNLKNPYLNTAKKVTSLITGLLFFSGGYFVSQVPATVFFSFLGLSASAMVWPILVTTVAIGLTAFGLYWFVQRPGVDAFVARIFGLDQEKIDLLDKKGKEVSAESKLEHLAQRLDSKTKAKISVAVGTDDVLEEPKNSPLWAKGEMFRRNPSPSFTGNNRFPLVT